MPAKAPLDENVKFLYSCLIRSDYKTIDFSRVAADFAINPAAARMRWSRLKKSINPDDTRPQFASDPLPKKAKKKVPKTPKEEKEEKEEKSIKEEVKELEFEDAIEDKSTPRKAKLKAGKRIGVVVKNEQTSDVDDDMGGGVSSGDRGDDEEMLRAPGNEQPAAAAVTATASAPQIQELFKTEEQDDAGPLQIMPENTQNNTRDLQTTSFLNPPDMFPIPPATFILPPVTSLLDQIAVPEKSGEDDDDDDGWGATIIVKQEPNPDPKTPTKRKFSATLGSTSPASSVSSFSPPSPSHSSPSPSRTPRKSERTPQKWQAIVSRSRQPRSKSRKIYSEENEDEDEDDYNLAL
ncbi:uncharacterized protein LAJ45_00775 [Morchella importuna]|uniref:uncharacterized protein n=1 Tax=Morchella importuna TaxID=1174673 RepID=UPI001E8D0320|nr:uncharacterized protein LAJ45_00775 [Morchella importuna]KAH8155765.1 hypothetical protein LAJ45_00775 [Morchella importuna]